MRHAALLHRGLAETSKALERPYIPRHVPLPSSSWTSSSSSSSAPRPLPAPSSASASSRAHPSACAPVPASNRNWDTDAQSDLPSRPFKERGVPRTSARVLSQPLSQYGHTASVKGKARAGWEPSVSDRSPITCSRFPQLPAVYEHSVATSEAKPPQRTSATSNGAPLTLSWIPHYEIALSQSAMRDRTARRLTSVNDVMQLYPHLSQVQAAFLLQVWEQLYLQRAKSSGEIVRWYQDFVWSQERQLAQDLQSPLSSTPSTIDTGNEDRPIQTLETQQSLSMMLNFAFRAADAKSLQVLASRAHRRRLRLLASSEAPNSGTLSPARAPSQDTSPFFMNFDDLWPEPDEDPVRLAFNLRISLAAKTEDWLLVNHILDTARTKRSRTAQTSGSRTRHASRSQSDLTDYGSAMLSEFGWFSLLRYGLGQVNSDASVEKDPAAEQTKSPQDTSTQTAPAAKLTGSSRSRRRRRRLLEAREGKPDDVARSTEHVVEDGNTEAISEWRPEDKMARAQEAEGAAEVKAKQAHAKLIATKRLLPVLLRLTADRYGGAATHSRQTALTSPGLPQGGNEGQTTALGGSPSWLLLSVLDQLAGRGETRQILRIIRLAIGEKQRSVSSDTSSSSEGSARDLNQTIGTDMLNTFLDTATRDLSWSLGAILEVFAELTGKDLAAGIGMARSPKASSSATGASVAEKQSLGTAESGVDAGRALLRPSEESLVLILRNLPDVCFKTSWSWRLYQNYRAQFGGRGISGRTWRLLLRSTLYGSLTSTSQFELARTQKSSTPASFSRRQTGRKLKVKTRLLNTILDHLIGQWNYSDRSLHLSATNRYAFVLSVRKLILLLDLRRHDHYLVLERRANPHPEFVSHHHHAIHTLNQLIAKLEFAKGIH
ncbi:hypothetical protein BCV70DRAFT_236946 [Testicularia cyperi]|uniref:Uncharacterized protein n=1 Tax=Testicularia cyperi TaxID=1882483 RepID=A0A317XRR0_9BASI|nr:hypothetical protein BCV70DRAFT_236946 [Testicularia cyperi]